MNHQDQVVVIPSESGSSEPLKPELTPTFAEFARAIPENY